MNDLPFKYRVIYTLSETVGPALVGAIARTLTIDYYGLEHLEAAQQQGNFVFACLHGRMFVPVWVQRRQGITALVSQSRDGEAVTRLVSAIGYETVRGSSHRGAREALRGMIDSARSGVVAVMVDGPRGPREEPKVGTLAIARAAGVPIVPMLAGAYPSWELHSWDRFQIPKPFSRAVMAYGEPMTIPKGAKGDRLEELRLDLKQRLLDLRDEADRLVRVKP